jgi:hypothetical protein
LNFWEDLFVNNQLIIKLFEGFQAMTGQGMWLFMLIIPLIFIIFFLFSYRFYRSSEEITLRAVPVRALLTAIILVVVAAIIRFTFEIEFLFPEVIRTKATFFKWTAMEILVAGVFGWALGARIHLCGILSASEPEQGRAWVREMFLSILVISSAFLFEARFLAPVYHEVRQLVDPNGITLQTHDATCGPAALATLFNLYGVHVTEREIARTGKTRRNGMTGGELAEVVRKMGYDCWYGPCNLDYILLVDRPCIIGVDDDHWIVLMSRNERNGKLVAGNPSFGLDLYDSARLAQEWGGKALFIGKGYGTLNSLSSSGAAALDNMGIMGNDENVRLTEFRARFGLSGNRAPGLQDFMALAPIDRAWSPGLRAMKSHKGH